MNYITKGLLAIVLSYTLLLQGCSLAWIGTLDSVLAAAAPALNNIVTIVSLAQGKPVNQALEDKITKDAAALKQLASDFAKNSGTNPTTCQEVQAGAAVLNDDAAVVLALVNATGNSNISAIFAAADAFVVIIVGLIPSCASPSSMKAGIPAKVAKIDARGLIVRYNQVLTAPSGKPAVDAFAKANTLPVHGKFVHIVIFGKVK